MKALIFDMDGLMIDSERFYIETEHDMARDMGKIFREETITKMMGRSPLQAMEIFCRDLEIDEQRAPELLAERDVIMERRLRNELEALPGLFEIIERYRGRLQLAIATGAPMKFLDIVVDKLKIRDNFTVLQSSDTVKEGKPSPEIYLKAAAGLGIEPAECVVLEDSSNGALAGKRAGSYVVAVPSEHTYKQDFSFSDYVAKDLHDAAEHIEGLI